jgi:hypothetical protein
MNKKQKMVLLVGVGLIVLIGLVPPWHYDVFETGQLPKKIHAGYGFLFSPPTPPVTWEHAALTKIHKEVRRLLRQGKEDEALDKVAEVVKANKIDIDKAADWLLEVNKGLIAVPHIDLSRLLVQWAVVAIAMAGIALFLKDSNAISQKGNRRKMHNENQIKDIRI